MKYQIIILNRLRPPISQPKIHKQLQNRLTKFVREHQSRFVSLCIARKMKQNYSYMFKFQLTLDDNLTNANENDNRKYIIKLPHFEDQDQVNLFPSMTCFYEFIRTSQSNTNTFLRIQNATEDGYIYSNPEKSNTFLANKRMSTFLNKFTSQIDNLMLRQTDLNTIYKLVAELANEMEHVNSTLIQDSNGLNALQVLERTSTKIFEHFDEINSHYKRKKKIYIASVVCCTSRNRSRNSL